MPHVLEAPEIAPEDAWQHYHDDDQPLVTLPPPPRHGCVHRGTRAHAAQAARLRHDTRQYGRMRIGPPQWESGVDRLAREYPFLYVLATAG